MKIGNSDDFYAHRYIRHDKVTGSLCYYSAHWPDKRNVRFFLDAGSKQGEDDDKTFNSFIPFDIHKASFGIITHNHLDHVGLLPVAVRQEFNGKIYMSYATASLIDITLYGAASIVDDVSKTTLCNSKDVEKTLKQVVGCRIGKVIHPAKDITITFFPNGHIVGAVMVLIEITCPGREPIRIWHTGDYKPDNIFFDVEKPPLDVSNMKISNTVCESTYGDVDSTDPRFNKCLEKNTAEAIKNGMTVIFPTFAEDRHQRVLYYIKTWKERGIIPKDTPVVVDGRNSQEYNRRYKYMDLGIKNEMKDFMPKDVYTVSAPCSSTSSRKKFFGSEPKIILAPSGMGDHGAITCYLKEYIPRSDALIHSLGYCSPSSIMYKLLNTPKGERIRFCGEDYTVRCMTAKTSELSSHAQRDQLLELLQSFPNNQSISINHGEKDVQLKFREYLLENLDLPEDQIITANPDIGVRIESSGITGLFKTKFQPVF